MSTSTLDPDNEFEVDRGLGKGHGTKTLGPSNSSDSGSDVSGLLDNDNDTDADGTGERGSVDMMDAQSDTQDIDVDRIEESSSDVDDELDQTAGDLDEAITTDHPGIGRIKRSL